MRAAVAQLV